MHGRSERYRNSPNISSRGRFEKKLKRKISSNGKESEDFGLKLDVGNENAKQMKLDITMTSSETNNLGGLPQKIQRGSRIEQVARKPSFKCPVPNRPSSNQRITRKVMLPMSTVQALTSKFNELSHSNQTQIKTNVKGRKGQALVKRGVNGKSSTITVVICRKPSSLKLKKLDERKRISLEDSDIKPTNQLEINKTPRNVLQRVTEFEERRTNLKSNEKVVPKRTSNILVPRVIVDIDLSDDRCLNNSETPKSTSDSFLANSWSVKRAIDKFEKNIGGKTPLSVINRNNRNRDSQERDKSNNVDENENNQMKTESTTLNKPRPIATIKPILKKTDDRSYPISSLSPKDSLYRKKYVGMKRDQTKSNKENDQDLVKECKKMVITNDEPKTAESKKKMELPENLKNTSSLFNHISQKVRWEAKENELPIQVEDDSKAGNLKPNTSFLWSKKEECANEQSEKINRSDMPLPLPPENYIPDIAESERNLQETIYDDVQPKSEEFDKASNHSDETVYDDIGVYNKNGERYEKINGGVESAEVRKKNFLNTMVNGQVSDSLYCISDNLVYNYDDCEGERYHYIRNKDSENTGQCLENESYQYVQNEDEDNNIYEDIQSVRNRLLTKDNNTDPVMNCYESVYGKYSNTDVNQAYIRSNSSDVSNNSGRSTYEKSNSLYGMTTGSGSNSDHRPNSTEASETEEHDVYHASPFGTAHPSSESGHSNSDEWIEVSDTESEQTVYLVQERPRKSRSGASRWAQKERRRWLKMQKGDFSSEMRVEKQSVQCLQQGLLNQSKWTCSSSESTVRKRPEVGDIIYISSQSVIYLGDFENKIINISTYDFKNEDDTDELKILFTIPRPLLWKKVKPAPSFRAVLYKTDTRECQEVITFIEDESKNSNSEDHFYESIGQCQDSENSKEDREKYYQEEQLSQLDYQQIYNEDLCIDDFDSQSSEDEAIVDAKLPETPNNGYNITKSLKAAGKKLRKNFSLRTSDFSKSLKRFKRQSRPKLTEKVFSVGQDVSVNDTSQNYGSHLGSNISINLNHSDSSTGSNILDKSNSSNDTKSFGHRKTWTFRNKFRKNSSTDLVSEQDSSEGKSSVFYLSLNEVHGQKNDEFLNEIQTLISNRNSNSLENVSVDKRGKKDSFRRQSQTSEVRVSSRPRPSMPPPPPPPGKNEVPSDGTRYSDVIITRKDKGINNSLYVESGLFDKQQKRSRCMTDSSKSWYAEVGLYAANENSSHVKKSQMFVDEPLYQFYTECVNQQARDDIMQNYDSEGYEEINDYYSIINEKRRTLDIKNVRPNFEDFNDDITPKPVTFRPHTRTLWCQIPAVIDSCVLKSLPDQVKKLQEAKFEILTSEESYMNSLNVLENHFMKKISESDLIPKRQKKLLFSNILPVKKCSENFLNDLENCWQNNIMLNGICEIVHKHSVENFNVYVKYCKNQISIYRTLRELIDENSNFESALKEIESDPICQNLTIHSFLMLPMQRITRLPLLLGAVLARLEKTDDEYEVCKASFEVLNKIVQECDEEAKRMEKCEEMLILSQQLEFPREIRGIPIITGQRFLVKSGQVTQLVNREGNKLTFGKKFSKVNLTLFLFTDLLVLTKKKSIRNYVVVDHCPRNLVQMQTTEGLTQIPVKLSSNSDSGGKYLMLLTMLENHEKKTVEMVLSFEMESDRQRWLEAVTPKLSENPDESIYEEWDCPQVIALYEFTSTQPDELSLCIGDVVNVLKKMNDGWYQGERLRDGARGWFPQNHTQEILSPHVRAKNKKLRYKILALTGNFIESQMKNGKQ